MTFCPFNIKFPEVAESETKSLTVVDASKCSLILGDYFFQELFCSEAHCDCRNAMITVVHGDGQNYRRVGTLRYLWEDRSYYEKIRLPFPEDWEIPGVVADLFTEEDQELLDVKKHFSELINQPASFIREPSETYGERIQRHYGMMRDHFDSLALAPSKRVPRNKPCPCGSEKKYKHCCAKEAL